MPLYVFRCPVCEYRVETPVREPAPTCYLHSAAPLCAGCVTHEPDATTMVRDYRSENAGITGITSLRHTGHESGRDSNWRDFLPSTDDFKGPSDPEGTSGLRKWRDEHQPANRHARHPEEHLLRRSW